MNKPQACLRLPCLHEAGWCGIFLAIASCTVSPTVPAPPVEPILYAVLVPGSPLTFARKSTTGVAYEVLPSTSVLLRLINAYPETIHIILKFRDGSTSAPLELVSPDDNSRRETLKAVGYYDVEVDSYGYTVRVFPPELQRTGPGFYIAMKNITSNAPPGIGAESKELLLDVLPRPNRTKPSAVFFDCGTDFDAVDGKWHYNCHPGASVVSQNFTLEGWLIESTPNPLSGLWVEDWHYVIVPNPDFIDAFYGPAGMFRALLGKGWSASLRLPGNPSQLPSVPLLFDDVNVSDGLPKGVTINSFVLPGTNSPPIAFATELNAWHPNDQGTAFARHWKGRGPAPAGWVPKVRSTTDPNYAEWNNTRWPFDPERPDLSTLTLKSSYVRINGALWQDTRHDKDAAWDAVLPGHAGWLEIHPVDWLEQLPPPERRKTPVLVAFIHKPEAPSPAYFNFAPEDAQQPGEVLRCREFVDGRFTTMATIGKTITVTASNVLVVVGSTTPAARFKAVYIVWWERGATPDATCSAG